MQATPVNGDDLDPAVEPMAAAAESVTNETDAFARLLVAFSEDFDRTCDERHAMGAERYGPGKFLTVDTLEEAMQEVVDLANYARYTYIKLRMLQAYLAQGLDVQPEFELGNFVKARQATAVKEQS